MTEYWPIQLELRIDWSELDLFGHVNNVSIMKYFQAARVLYLEKIGLMQSQAETKIGPILASATCQFRKPLHYPGRVVVHCRVDLVKSSSFRIAHRLVDDSGDLAAEAQDIIVLYDFNQGTKTAITGSLRETITRLESTGRL
jgi:acyl-CoA thioester hydrolase